MRQPIRLIASLVASLVASFAVAKTARIAALTAVLLAAPLAATPAAALDVNSFRAQHKLKPLTQSATLAGAAQAHARDMAKRKTMDHRNFQARMAGVSRGAGAENVAYGCATAPCVYKMWIDSPGHRANMLLRTVTRYGLGSAVADDGQRYWTLLLGN